MKKTARILVIHSSSVMRYMIKCCFDTLGYSNTTMVADGAAGLELLDEYAFGLVLFDCDLPDMSGIGLLQVIRSDRALGCLPVIMMVGSGDRAVEHQAWRYGIDAFVKRPTTETVLQAVLASVLGCMESASAVSRLSAKSLDTRNHVPASDWPVAAMATGNLDATLLPGTST